MGYRFWKGFYLLIEIFHQKIGDLIIIVQRMKLVVIEIKKKYEI